MVVALAVAIVVAVILVKSRTPLEHVAVEMPSRSVEVVSASEIPFRSRVTAYGNVEPAITLHSMAELSGNFAEIMGRLRPDYLGKIVHSSDWLSRSVAER